MPTSTLTGTFVIKTYDRNVFETSAPHTTMSQVPTTLKPLLKKTKAISLMPARASGW